MKLNAQITGESHALSLNLNDGLVNAVIDGRTYDLEVRHLPGGEYLILHGASVYKCRIDARDSARNAFSVNLRGRSFDVTITDPRRLPRGKATAGHDHGAAEIVSPMPGKVVRVLVKPGATVKAGDGIIVVEAMKMQNEMKAPKAGVVVSINAEDGATVNAGEVLAVIN
jgi:biotin carboxyl carrier protein